jgi:hypothetical protein
MPLVLLVVAPLLAVAQLATPQSAVKPYTFVPETTLAMFPPPLVLSGWIKPNLPVVLGHQILVHGETLLAVPNSLFLVAPTLAVVASPQLVVAVPLAMLTITLVMSLSQIMLATLEFVSLHQIGLILVYLLFLSLIAPMIGLTPIVPVLSLLPILKVLLLETVLAA